MFYVLVIEDWTGSFGRKQSQARARKLMGIFIEKYLFSNVKQVKSNGIHPLCSHENIISVYDFAENHTILSVFTYLSSRFNSIITIWFMYKFYLIPLNQPLMLKKLPLQI